ncbi:glycosyltransferase family 4 protein [Desulfohalobiaceae bacterium Ax17]|uniref:glycosyltransferase family 4 protein n=1 Tax=Desulfovulcanus ferrireducens TaxID=2831190 RepID=UPI00207BB79E|nr:glycosyltransferase family 4 protein [Desulfovulcanus ferrireducens]MBT8764473.1 glycosyltransferase family 4 protein [Desulfovulcanus ferrireducens]
MKILIFNWRDIKKPGAGGAEVYTHEVAKRLVHRGHSVTLFTSMFKNGLKMEYIDGVKIIRAGSKFSVYWKGKEYYKKFLAKQRFDVVIDEINTRPFFAVDFVNKGEKTVALIHQLAREFWFYETPSPINLIGYHFLEKIWLKKYKNVPTITVSNSTKEDLKKWGFENIFVVHNGLNVQPLDKIPKKSDKPVVIFVGRMKKAKKPQDVIEAFKIVRKKIKEAELWMVGDGYMRAKLEDKNVQGVKFWGYVDKNTKDELVKKAWVIAVPGVREGWGQVVTDANALGTPAVGYDIPGLRDSIKNGYNGILVKPHLQFFADALINVLENVSFRKQLSQNAIKWAKQFSWDRSADEFERLIKITI